MTRRFSAAFASGVGLVASWGCGAGTPAPDPPSPPASAAPSAKPPSGQESAAAAAHADANARAVARALEHVSALRGLPAKHPVRSRTMSRQDIARHVQAHIDKQVPDSVVQGSTALLVGLGVVPVDFDYVASFLAFMTSEIAGLYEPDDDTMYLAEDLDAATRDMTLDHELVHALQDQYWDLGTRLDYEAGKGDAQSALHALAEGGATSLMLDALLEPQGRSSLDMPDAWMRMQVLAGVELSPGVQSVPSIIRRSVAAPYVDGLSFVNARRRKGGWTAVDGVWMTGISSTEQLLHPEKLAAGEQPESIDAPKAPDPSWTPIYSDVIGEQALKIVFEEWMPAGAAGEAAAAWGGDHVTVFQSGDDWLTVAHLRWDDEPAAVRGFTGLARGGTRAEAPVSRTAAEQLAKRAEACRERPDRGPFAVRRTGRDVALVLGPFRKRDGIATTRGNCVTALGLATRVLSDRS